MEKSLSFTGHRLHKLQSLLDGNELSTTDKSDFLGVVKDTLYVKVNYYIDQGFRKFYVGMSDGIDLWAGQILLELKSCQYPDIEIVAVQPFYHHGKDFSQTDRLLYRKILDSANSVVCLDYKNSKWSYLKRDRYLVDNSTNLLAFVDDFKSGTGYTIKYAKQNRKPIDIVDLSTIKSKYISNLT